MYQTVRRTAKISTLVPSVCLISAVKQPISSLYSCRSPVQVRSRRVFSIPWTGPGPFYQIRGGPGPNLYGPLLDRTTGSVQVRSKVRVVQDRTTATISKSLNETYATCSQYPIAFLQ